MSINWIFWTPRKKYGLYTVDVVITGVERTTIPVDIKVEIVTEHTMGYEVEVVEIVSGGEYFADSIKEKILKSVPNFLEVGKVLINEN